MRELTRKEELQLGRDLGAAKIKVLVKWGFSITEIANIMEVSESIVRSIMKEYDIKESE